MTQAEIDRALYGRRKGGRIHVSPANERTIDGILFASKREMMRYMELKIEEKIGVILDLRLQVPFPIFVTDPAGNKVQVFKWIADFVYRDREGRQTTEDCKGMRTETYRLKKKAVEAQYGIRILET